MSSEWLTLAVLLLTFLTLFSGLLGIIIRYALLPYLRENLTLMQETHQQVTANSHASNQPTVLDRLEDVMNAVTDTNDRLDAHLQASEQENLKLWRALIGGIAARNRDD